MQHVSPKWYDMSLCVGSLAEFKVIEKNILRQQAETKRAISDFPARLKLCLSESIAEKMAHIY